MAIRCESTAIEAVKVFHSPVFHDDRGYFQELFNQRGFHDAGLDVTWVQDNLSRSAKNVVRGLHYQLDKPQAKLVRVLTGAVLDCVVDLRRSSPTFGRHVAIELAEGDGKALFVPEGFAHGFSSLQDGTTMLYKVSDFQHVAGERTLLWNDPELNLAWPIEADDAILSAKDRLGLPLAAATTYA